MVCPPQPAITPTPPNYLHLNDSDHLAPELPAEIVSQIFVTFDQVNEPEGIEPGTVQHRHWEHSMHTPALLSRVCGTWRNIVLSTPQLWTKLSFDIATCARPGKLEFLGELLARSGSLPLSLMLRGIKESVPYPLAPLMDVIRPSASRWKSLDIVNLSAELASKLLHGLNHILPSVLEGLRIDRLSILHGIHLREPLRPKHLSIQRMESFIEVPLEWDNITHLEMSQAHISTLLHFIKQMPRLTSWRSEGVSMNVRDQMHHFPEDAIVNPNLKHLELTFKENNGIFFRHLTLPGLTHLRCHFGSEVNGNDPDLQLEDLIDFLARSRLDSKSLQTLDLKYNLFKTNYDKRIGELKALTHLVICILDGDMIINSYLSEIQDISVFPHLRDLQIRAFNVPSSTWAILCGALRERPLLASDVSVCTSGGFRPPPGFHRRPLQHLSLQTYGDKVPTIPREDYSFFRDIEKAGIVKLEFRVAIFRRGTVDILQSMAQVYDGDLP